MYLFNKKKFEKLPNRWEWDHEINLMEEAPKELNAKAYPMILKEKETLSWWLDEQLKARLIIKSITNGHLLICDWCFRILKGSKMRNFRQWQKMLLSLRSNPQTMSPYIQKSDGLCTSTDHHLITTYCSTYSSIFVLEIVIT